MDGYEIVPIQWKVVGPEVVLGAFGSLEECNMAIERHQKLREDSSPALSLIDSPDALEAPDGTRAD